MYDLIIKDGLIVDGSGRSAFLTDLGIKGERIYSVGGLEGAAARRVIMAGGLAVSPGFIDVHGHSDLTLLVDRSAPSKIRQGITTEVGGNCGFSGAPALSQAQKKLESRKTAYDLTSSWTYLEEYLEILQAGGLGINFVPLVGQGNLRASVVGYEDRSASPEEIEKMKSLLARSLKEGAFGLSSGLLYPPGCFTPTEELIALTRIVADSEGIYASHIRGEGDHLLEAITEALATARESRVKLQISHLKTAGKKNHHKIDEVFRLIDEALTEGLDLGTDCYPYAAGATDLDAVLPPWTYEGGIEEEIRRLKDPSSRQRLKKEMEDTDWDEIMISGVVHKENQWMEGKRISEVAEFKEIDPFEFLLDLLIEEKAGTSAIYFSMSESNLRRILRQPYCTIGSDASARHESGPLVEGKVHPRTFGAFPRVLAKYVREEKEFSLEEAVHKMTGQPATRFGLPDRGIIGEGMFADLVIFDPGLIKDTATYQSPYHYPEGIEYVILNGRLAVDKGIPTGILSGRVIRKCNYLAV